ncbi:MAG: hypothetical protein ACLPH3_05995 [Terracidiphilus sp.]
MSLIKKVDVANYFSSRKRKGIHAQRTVSQADATGYSGKQSGRVGSHASDAVEKTLDQEEPKSAQA